MIIAAIVIDYFEFSDIFVN